MEKELILPFLGNRDYIQGATLFDNLIQYVPEPASIIFNITGFIRSDRVKISDQKDKNENSQSAVLKWFTDEESGNIFVNKLETSGQERRIESDEGVIQKRMKFSERRAHFIGPSQFSFMSTVVFANKALIRHCQNDDEQGKLIFVRADLIKIPRSIQTFELKLDHVTRKNMYLTQILSGKEVIGDIYFLKT